MKTIIIYVTKYGSAGEVAQKIAGKINGALVHDLKQGDVPSLADYDCIIFGCSVYASNIRKEAKAFIFKNENILKEKKLGIFLLGLDKKGKKKYLEANFPQVLLQTAKATGFFGGVFDPKKAGVMVRLLMRIITKTPNYISTIDNDKIDKFIEAIK